MGMERETAWTPLLLLQPAVSQTPTIGRLTVPSQPSLILKCRTYLYLRSGALWAGLVAMVSKVHRMHGKAVGVHEKCCLWLL